MLSSFLDNAPTYLSFLSASFGVFATPEIVEGVKQALATNGEGLAALTGPHADLIRDAYAGLQQYFGVSGGEATDAQIELAVLLGNAALNQYIIAISVAAVFFGAFTYIGNGPNFMVKSIADQQKVHAPTFLGYVFRFTIPVMVPVVAVIWLIFFR